MKQILRFNIFTVLVLSVLVLNACGVAPTAQVILPAAGDQESQSAPVEFTGAIDAINGNQWVVNGQPVVLDEQALGSASAFNVGDTVHVKGMVAQDGTVNVSGVESPAAKSAPGGVPDSNEDKSPAPQSAQGFAPVDSPATPEPSANPESTGQKELVGVVDAINGSEIIVDGMTYILGAGVMLPANLAVGDTVKIHFYTDAAGVLTIAEIQSGSGSSGSGGGGGSDDGNDDEEDDDDEDDDEDDDD